MDRFLYNGMIHPIVPFGIRGFSLVSGPNRTNGQGMAYYQLKKGLIEGWRQSLEPGGKSRFSIPVSPSWLLTIYGPQRPTDLPGIWEAQTETLTVKKHRHGRSDRHYHPQRHSSAQIRQEVGRRLALVGFWRIPTTRRTSSIQAPLFKENED